ncbi:MAG: serine/threonine protein kinase [Anaerolineae bacterium]|nr:serine/threonine protein kinase [Anaerolineae bacterium]
MSADPLLGKKLGDYTIQSLLGRGGMSRVYRGYDENLDRFAAVKVISGDFVTTTEEEYTRRFQLEARSIARLQHPNIVGVYQFGRSEGIYYMAMVFLEGKDLRAVLKEYAAKEQRMPAAEVLRIARDVASALDYAHTQGVIHRDIKPSNIMLEKQGGRAILMDFGLALSIHEGTTGDTFGSAHYIAPEQAISSAKAVPQSDLYSLGIVLYEMMAGKVPFDDPSAMSVALKHLNEVPPPPTLYNPDLPGEAEAVIMRVLEKKPEDRYTTGSDLVDALEKAFGVADASVSQPAVGPPVAELLESKPSAPSAPEKEPAPAVTPESPSTPSAPADDTDTKQRGVAGRFARRKARKEEEAALEELRDGTLQIDEDTLGAILKDYKDPRELGLVGPEAGGITLPKKAEETQGGKVAVKAIRQRSRSGLLAIMVVVVVLIVGGLYLGLDSGGGDEDEGAAAGTEAVAAVGTEEQTPAGTDEPTEEPTVEPTEEATQEATVRPTRTVESTPVEVAAATEGPTEETAEPTEEPTVEPTAEPTEEATEEPTQAPVEEPTKEPTEEPTQTPTDIPSPEPTEESAEPPEMTPTPGHEPNVRLVWEDNEFFLLNISGDTIDVNRLVFERIEADRTLLSFAVNKWNNRNSAERPYEMGADGCYQLITASTTQVSPTKALCPRFLGWYRATIAAHYFWISDDPDALFTVHLRDQDIPLAACEIAAGECLLYVPQP